MPVEVDFDAPLHGRVSVPGDERLTLSLMAFAMQPGAVLSIDNPSPAPSVAVFRDFLAAHGAGFEDNPAGFTIAGSGLPPEIIFGSDVPDEVLHILLPEAMQSGDVRVVDSGGSRLALIERLLKMLAPLGTGQGIVREGDGDIVIGRAAFNTPEAVVIARSDWEIEAIAAASGSLAAGISISYPAAVTSHSLKTIEMSGGRWETGADSRESKINRRLAKATGDIPPTVSRLIREIPSPGRVEVPGDTVIAAAVTAAALMLPKSRVTIERVLWEQGRRGFWDAARRMKGQIETKSRAGGAFESADLIVRHSELTGIQLSAAQSLAMRPELLLLGSLATAANGESVVTDTTDTPGMGRERFALLARALELLGCRVGNYTSGIVLEGGQILRGAHIDCGSDPAVALALHVAALNAAGETIIDGIDSDVWPTGVFRTILKHSAGALSG